MTPQADAIWQTVTGIINDMTREWDDATDLGPDTSLTRDLMFSSVDIIHLLGTIEMTYQRKFPYDALVINEKGGYRDVTVGDVVCFVQDHFDHHDAGPAAMR
jgi:acyl carrier protein